MPLVKDQGCGTPTNINTKQIYQRLTQLYAPILHFHPKERFFPVDLPSTVEKSGLWHTDLSVKPTTSNKERDFGQIIPVNHFPPTNQHHYTSVVGNDFVQKQVANEPPFQMPKPNLDKIFLKYKQSVDSKLTIYATVCKAKDVPNRDFFQGNVRNAEVTEAIDRGLFVNYYFFFPAHESPEFKSEGDWSGISLLLKDTPTNLQDLNDPQRVKNFLPVISCYFYKSISSVPPHLKFFAGDRGFRLWKDVDRIQHDSLQMKTHPVIYVSRGRHNCYYESYKGNTPLSPPVGGFSAEEIESGKLKTGPTEKTLQGGDDVPWWLYLLFPPFAAFVACATGCKKPFEFDRSGIPGGFQDGQDQAEDGGYNGLPNPNPSKHPGDTSDKIPAAQRNLKFQVLYVDLDDVLTESIWGYPGAWGGSCYFNTTPKWEEADPHIWGYYRGVRRPSLAPWFYLSLLMDYTYGAGGVLQLLPAP